MRRRGLLTQRRRPPLQRNADCLWQTIDSANTAPGPALLRSTRAAATVSPLMLSPGCGRLGHRVQTLAADEKRTDTASRDTFPVGAQVQRYPDGDSVRRVDRVAALRLWWVPPASRWHHEARGGATRAQWGRALWVPTTCTGFVSSRRPRMEV